jgi:preprotein translocase subunit SecD
LWRENVGYLVSTKAELDNGDIEGAKLFEVSAGEWKEVEISSQAHDGGESGDPSGREFGIRIALNKSGEKKLEDLTGANVERRLAVVLDGKLIQAPIIKQKIYGGKISLGHLSYSRAKNLKDAVSPGGN